VDWLDISNLASSIPKEIHSVVNQKALVRFKEELSLLHTSERFTTLLAVHDAFKDLMNIKRSEKLKLIFKSLLFFVAAVLVSVFYWRIGRLYKFNLLYDPPVPVRSKSERLSLHAFLKSPRFGFACSNTYIVQDRKLSFRGYWDKQIVPVFSIDLYLMSTLSLSERCRFVVRNFRNLITFFRLVPINPTIIHCYKELFFTIPCSRLALKRGAISEICITNSNWLYQPTTVHLRGNHVKAYMLWYSDNSASKYKDHLLSKSDFSAYGLAPVDCHYVWTKEFSSFLSQFTKALVRDVGSILFYESENFDRLDNGILSITHKSTDVLVFDVVPFEEPNNHDYYTKSRAFAFLLGIQHLREEYQRLGSVVQPKFAIKHKRKLQPSHSKEYSVLVNSLIRPQGNWEKIPEDSNIYSLIKSARLIVAPPFTSPALVAKELGVPSCFLDLGDNPTDFDNYCGLPVFRTYENFSLFAQGILNFPMT